MLSLVIVSFSVHFISIDFLCQIVFVAFAVFNKVADVFCFIFDVFMKNKGKRGRPKFAKSKI